MNKKEGSNWYLAAIHYLIAGLVTPFLFTALFSFIKMFSNFSVGLGQIISFIIIISSIWLGVMYSAKHLIKNYIIADIGAVINLSVTYFVVIKIISDIGAYTLYPPGQIVLADIFLVNILSFILFYLFSKKYINKFNNLQNIVS